MILSTKSNAASTKSNRWTLLWHCCCSGIATMSNKFSFNKVKRKRTCSIFSHVHYFTVLILNSKLLYRFYHAIATVLVTTWSFCFNKFDLIWFERQSNRQLCSIWVVEMPEVACYFTSPITKHHYRHINNSVLMNVFWFPCVAGKSRETCQPMLTWIRPFSAVFLLQFFWRRTFGDEQLLVGTQVPLWTMHQRRRQCCVADSTPPGIPCINVSPSLDAQPTPCREGVRLYTTMQCGCYSSIVPSYGPL